MSNTVVSEKTYPVRHRWLLRTVVVAVVLMVVFSFPTWFFSNGEDGITTPFWLFLGVIALLTIGIYVNIWLQLSMFRFRLEPGVLVIRQDGLKPREFPWTLDRVKDVSVTQDFLDRLLGLWTVTIQSTVLPTGVRGPSYASDIAEYTSLIGVSGRKVIIPGLTQQHATELRARILAALPASATVAQK